VVLTGKGSVGDHDECGGEMIFEARGMEESPTAREEEEHADEDEAKRMGMSQVRGRGEGFHVG